MPVDNVSGGSALFGNRRFRPDPYTLGVVNAPFHRPVLCLGVKDPGDDAIATVIFLEKVGVVSVTYAPLAVDTPVGRFHWS